MANKKIISADDHVFEPVDLWTSRVEGRYNDRAPHVVRMQDGSDWWVCDGQKLLSAMSGAQVGLRFEEPEKMTLSDVMENVRPGGHIPEEHVKDMDVDGVDVSFLYPTVCLKLFFIQDSDLLTALFSAYNDWIAEHCNAAPDKLKGIGMLNPDDVQVAVKELERCAKMGLVGALITVYPDQSRAYDSREYEPIWAAAQDLGMPISLHIGTYRRAPGQDFVQLDSVKPSFMSTRDHWVRVSLADMIFSGVFERYPKLQVGSIEMDLAWVPYCLDSMDYVYTQLAKEFVPYRFKEDMLPRDYFRRNIFLSFQEDALGIKMLRDIIGVDNLLWGSDYPHQESTFPRSKEILQEILVDCTEEEKAKITCDNTVRVYNLK